MEVILELCTLAKLGWNGGKLHGQLTGSKRTFELVKKLNESDFTEIQFRIGSRITSITDIGPNLEFSVEISPPRGWQCALAKNDEDLLSIANIHSLPENFALTQTGYKSWDSSIAECDRPSIVKASDLLKHLQTETIVETLDGRFVLSNYDSKITIPYTVATETIHRSSESVKVAIDGLKELFADSLHSSEKKRILRNALLSSLKACDENQRLGHFLLHSAEIINNAQHNYELFVSGFSFQNDLEKLQEQKRDFSVKLNGLLIGIQGKLLAIPASTILATTQLKDEGDANYVIVNSSIMASSLFFLVIIVWLIRSQMLAIKSIESEIMQKEKRFKLELPRLFLEVKAIFDSLKSDCKLNLRMAWILIILSFLFTFVTWHIFLVKTNEIFWMVDAARDSVTECTGWLLGKYNQLVHVLAIFRR
ncbi:hypothetical protein NPS29_16000 [Pseudomonas putida]|uniref:hypothetical protein n=1 Tax=Pseudomonas putida TaxID=303 RepID=UPI002363FD22|nr:hypothetical protein [Pseudomonas putida]MDD1966830.1 hypothetical protein [Pseudomonas putida]